MKRDYSIPFIRPIMAPMPGMFIVYWLKPSAATWQDARAKPDENVGIYRSEARAVAAIKDMPGGARNWIIEHFYAVEIDGLFYKVNRYPFKLTDPDELPEPGPWLWPKSPKKAKRK